MGRVNKIVAVAITLCFTSTTTFAATGLWPSVASKRKAGEPCVTFQNTYLAMQQSEAAATDGTSPRFTSSKGMMDGEMHGERISTGGKVATGLVVGVLTGLIGTGIGYLIIGSSQMDGQALTAMEDKGEDYTMGFRTGWNKKTKSRKRNAFLGGGLLGTAAFVVIYLSAVRE